MAVSAVLQDCGYMASGGAATELYVSHPEIWGGPFGSGKLALVVFTS